MAIHEADDPVKSRLLKRSEKHREELVGEVKGISEQTERILTTALVAGGILALGYFLVSELSHGRGSKKKTKKERGENDGDEQREEPGVLGQIGATLANHVVLFLLDVARQKLSEYLESKKERIHENS